MYFPFLLESMMPGVEITFGILYKSASTLAMHYDYISNGTNYDAFDFYHTGDGWSTTATKNIDYALAAAAWIAAHNIIQQHGTSVGVTDANCYIAQKCAAIAVKKPYEITDLTALNIV